MAGKEFIEMKADVDKLRDLLEEYRVDHEMEIGYFMEVMASAVQDYRLIVSSCASAGGQFKAFTEREQIHDGP